MKLLLLLPLLLGLMSPAIAHNRKNTKCPPGQAPMCVPFTDEDCFCMDQFAGTEK